MACVPPPPPPPACVADCDVPLVLPAADVADEVLAWFTAPLLEPGLRIATWIAWLVGLTCVEVASDDADCLLAASCPMSCEGTPSAEAVVAASAGSTAAAHADHPMMVF